MELEAVDASGSGRRRSLALAFRVRGAARPRYLELSGRLFGDPPVVPGDVVELGGKAAPVGVYVTEIAALRTGR